MSKRNKSYSNFNALIHSHIQHPYFTGVFIAETAHPSMRRFLGPFQAIGASLGGLLTYTITAFLPWRLSKLILSLAICLPAAFVILLCEETPHWLVKKGRIDEARYVTLFVFGWGSGAFSGSLICYRKSIAFYRGKECCHKEKELQAIMENEANEVSSTTNINLCGQLTIFKSQAFLRPFICAGVLFILNNMTGIFIIVTFSASFLKV